MRLHDLAPAPGARHSSKRLGRGHGSGRGKTAGRGTKGQNSRQGSNVPLKFEGGQNPIVNRMPFLRGFKNNFKLINVVINVSELSDAFPDGGDVTYDALVERGLVRASDQVAPAVYHMRTRRDQVGHKAKRVRRLKVLGSGELTAPLIVHAHAFSRSAREAIEAAGGRVVVLDETPAAGSE